MFLGDESIEEMNDIDVVYFTSDREREEYQTGDW